MGFGSDNTASAVAGVAEEPPHQGHARAAAMDGALGPLLPAPLQHDPLAPFAARQPLPPPPDFPYLEDTPVVLERARTPVLLLAAAALVSSYMALAFRPVWQWINLGPTVGTVALGVGSGVMFRFHPRLFPGCASPPAHARSQGERKGGRKGGGGGGA